MAMKNDENRENINDQLLLLNSLYRHGNNVFSDEVRFNKWLNTENFFFDGACPASMLNTISGIRFVDDRLSAMEYGDNV